MSRTPSLTFVLTLIPIVGLLAPGLIGCSSEPAGVAIEDIPLGLAGAVCAQFSECADARADGGPLGQLLLSRSFMDRCPEYLSAEIGSLDYLSAAVNAGRITYNAAAARRCIDEVSASCLTESGVELFPSCRDAIRGNVAPGGACSFTEECSSGAHCNAELTGSTCAGTCVAGLAVGAPCNNGDECAAPTGIGRAECRGNGGQSNVCVVFSLAAAAGEGQPCGDVVRTGLQRSFAQCQRSLFCYDPNDTGVGSCTREIPDGGVCLDGQACERGSVCMENDAGTESFCRHLTIRTRVGDVCDDATVFCDNPARLVCVAGRCATMPAGTCDGAYHCESGEFCDDQTDTCTQLKPLNAECANSDQCLSGACRDDNGMPGTRRCVEPEPRCG